MLACSKDRVSSGNILEVGEKTYIIVFIKKPKEKPLYLLIIVKNDQIKNEEN